MKTHLKLFVVCISALGVISQRKPGDCPPGLDVDVCSVTCRSDTHCPETEKCCRTSCGGTFCVAPITSRQPDSLYVKRGSCPEPYGPWVCTSRCSFDGDCRGRKKCCKNRCGAMACVNTT